MTRPSPSAPTRHVYIVSAARTPIGKFGGALSTTPAVELGGVAIRAAVERAGLPEGTPIDEALIGQVLQAGAGQAPARHAPPRPRRRPSPRGPPPAWVAGTRPCSTRPSTTACGARSRTATWAPTPSAW